MWAATAKPSRMYMPEEYVRTWRSMNSPSSEKAAIWSNRSSIVFRFRP